LNFDLKDDSTGRWTWRFSFLCDWKLGRWIGTALDTLACKFNKTRDEVGCRAMAVGLRAIDNMSEWDDIEEAADGVTDQPAYRSRKNHTFLRVYMPKNRNMDIIDRVYKAAARCFPTRGYVRPDTVLLRAVRIGLIVMLREAKARKRARKADKKKPQN